MTEPRSGRIATSPHTEGKMPAARRGRPKVGSREISSRLLAALTYCANQEDIREAQRLERISSGRSTEGERVDY